MKTDVVLLPGLHGSTALFDTFIALAPPWARCRPVALPTRGAQNFDALADALETQLRALEGFVLFGESFSGPIAARLARRLDSKVALLVLCNPLIDAPIAVAPSLASRALRSRWIPSWPVAFVMTGGDRPLAGALMREVRALPHELLRSRLDVVATADRDDLLAQLQAPLLGIAGSEDRLLAPKVTRELIGSVPFGVYAEVAAAHLAAQTAPSQVWNAISEEFERAA
jgi:pimeloyl-ACP methyl ester carboxylesterase